MPKFVIPEPALYYAYQDEKAFFTWLEGIKGIVSVKGQSFGLEVTIRSKSLSDSSLHDLIALFMRYGLDMKPLVQFKTARNKTWFCDEKAYWHKYIFGTKTHTNSNMKMIKRASRTRR